MENRIREIPEGYHSVTPALTINGASEAIEFYKKALGAVETFRQNRQDGKIMHATIKIGDSIIMLADECKPHEGHEECVRSPESLKGTSVNLYLYVKDADRVFNQAIGNGGKVIMAVSDMFWGDRMGMFKDPFGYAWSVATQKELVKPEQLKERTFEFCAQNPAVC